jgi:hypothetical protein
LQRWAVRRLKSLRNLQRKPRRSLLRHLHRRHRRRLLLRNLLRLPRHRHHRQNISNFEPISGVVFTPDIAFFDHKPLLLIIPDESYLKRVVHPLFSFLNE